MDNNDLNDLKCKFDYEFLFSKCQEIRDMVLKSIYYAQSGHPGGALSCVECLVMLYYCFLEITPQNFYDHMRNHFILSKGHAAPTLYSILADMGFFSISDLNTLRSIDSHLQGHPDKLKTNGVECSTGSLGMGLSVSVGIGWYLKQKHVSYKSYVLLGDGELQEGGIWESMMAAAHFRLDNVVALVDCNNYQLDGAVNDIMNVFPLKDKIDAFGWNTQVVDGHNLHQLFNTLSTPNTTGKPTCIILQTIKGKGVTEMENTSDWHSVRDVGKYKSIIEKYYVV